MATRVMGILNVTPDSFFDGGRFATVAQAVAAGRAMFDAGADVIDVGGESTRPGAEVVAAAEEIRRTVPVVEELALLGISVSIDTRKAAVARAALAAGASTVNDVSGGTFDASLAGAVAEFGADLVVMHMRGTPATMDAMTGYEDVVADVARELGERVQSAVEAGVVASAIWVDPGLGFAKTAEQSLELLRRVDELRALGRPIVVGPSRKRFVGHALGGADVAGCLEGTLAAVAWCAVHDVDMVRVHDVAEARRVVDVIAAIRGRVPALGGV